MIHHDYIAIQAFWCYWRSVFLLLCQYPNSSKQGISAIFPTYAPVYLSHFDTPLDNVHCIQWLGVQLPISFCWQLSLWYQWSTATSQMWWLTMVFFPRWGLRWWQQLSNWGCIFRPFFCATFVLYPKSWPNGQQWWILCRSITVYRVDQNHCKQVSNTVSCLSFWLQLLVSLSFDRVIEKHLNASSVFNKILMFILPTPGCHIQ